MKSVKINVSGDVGSGKTAIIALIAKMLEKYNTEYELSNSRMPDIAIEPLIDSIKKDDSYVNNTKQKIFLTEIV